MAAVTLTNKQVVNKRIRAITKDTSLKLHSAGISKQAVADAAGVSIQAVSAQFRRGQLTLTVYLAAQMLLENQ